jgi:hypothetical protein
VGRSSASVARGSGAAGRAELQLSAHVGRSAVFSGISEAVIAAGQFKGGAGILAVIVAFAKGGFGLILSVVPAGVMITVHRHPDQEALYVISGKPEDLLGCKLRAPEQRCVIDVPDDVPQAFRNGPGRVGHDHGRYRTSDRSPAIDA